MAAPASQTAQPSLRERLRYRFDNSMSGGPIALIGYLALASLLVIVVAAVLLRIFGITQEDGEQLSFLEGAWQSLMRTLDSGTMGGDTGWLFRIVMVLVTFGGIFVIASLIGVLTTGLESRLDELRKGRSVVVETGHTLILGWSPKVFTILSELAIANANVKAPRIVVLADRDKVEMEDDIRANVGEVLGRTKVVCRSGSPLSLVDLAIANPAQAKSIIVVAPESEHPDRWVLRALLALTNGPHRPAGANHIVATFQDATAMDVGAMIAPDDARLINVGDLIARIMAQTCRQSGLSRGLPRAAGLRRRRDLLPARAGAGGPQLRRGAAALPHLCGDRAAARGRQRRDQPGDGHRDRSRRPGHRDLRGRRHRGAVGRAGTRGGGRDHRRARPRSPCRSARW